MRALALLLFLLPLGAVAQSADSTGQIAGLVTDAATGEGVSVAHVSLREHEVEAYADLGGAFVLRGVPPGVYTVLVRAVHYDTRTVRSVEVKSGTETRLDVDVAVISSSDVHSVFPLIATSPYVSRIVTHPFGITGRWANAW